MWWFLIFCLAVLQVLNWVRDQAEKESDLQQYVPHLQSNTILRLLQQVLPLLLGLPYNLGIDLTRWFCFVRWPRSTRASSSAVWPPWFRLWTRSSWSAP